MQTLSLAGKSSSKPMTGQQQNGSDPLSCQAVLNNLVEGVWISDELGNITYLNHAMREILEFDGLDTSGLNILSNPQKHPVTEALGEHFTNARSNLSPVRFNNIEIKRIDGSQRHYHGTMTPSADNGSFSGLVCTMSDCTEIKFLAEEEKGLQTRLIQANKANALSTLVSGIAHEVNNPNNSIALGSELLSKYWQRVFSVIDEVSEHPALDQQTLSDLEEIRETGDRIIKGLAGSARRIAGVINNLREYGGRKTDHSRNLDVNDLISVCVSILHHMIKRHTNCFRFSPGTGLPHICGNSQQLMQVMINLIMNAVQSLGGTEDDVLISTECTPDRKQVLISIKDKGRGIPAEEITKIFEPFYTTRLACGGTGLGLAISQMIIQEHGGSLSISSLPGTGTTALIKLPTSSEDRTNAHENCN